MESRVRRSEDDAGARLTLINKPRTSLRKSPINSATVNTATVSSKRRKHLPGQDIDAVFSNIPETLEPKPEIRNPKNRPAGRPRNRSNHCWKQGHTRH